MAMVLGADVQLYVLVVEPHSEGNQASGASVASDGGFETYVVRRASLHVYTTSWGTAMSFSNMACNLLFGCLCYIPS